VSGSCRDACRASISPWCRRDRPWRAARDFLVLALGADLDPAGAPGLAEHAHTFYTVEGALRLKAALEAFGGGDVAIVIPKIPFKCPPAPYEAAMLLEHAFRARAWRKRSASRSTPSRARR